MATKLTIRLSRDNQITIHVEGLTEEDGNQEKGHKKCDRITKKIERDLGSVIQRTYCDGHGSQEGMVVDFTQSDENILSQDGE